MKAIEHKPDPHLSVSTMTISMPCGWPDCDVKLEAPTEALLLHAMKMHGKGAHNVDEDAKPTTTAPPRSDWSRMPVVGENV